MATSLFTRSLLLQKPTSQTLISSILSRSFTSHSPTSTACSSSLLRRFLRPLSAATNINRSVSRISIRSFSSSQKSSSLNDPSPNWSNRPPKETILLDGCDFEHWLVVMEKPEGDPTRDEIIDSYIKTLAQVVGSEEEARRKIYSVSTRCYYAFGALVPEEVSYKIKELKNVRWVLPDSYLDVKNKDYGGEPFIDGKAVPYDPKYHEEWIRNNARANERNRRNDRPRNVDRSRNFDRRMENMQQRGGAPPPPMANQAMRNPASNMAGQPQNMGRQGAPQPQNNYRGPGGPPPNNYNMGGPQNMGGPGGPPPNNYMGGQQNNMSRVPHNMPMQNYIPPQNNMPPQNYTPQQHNYVPPQNDMPPHNNTGGWSNDMPGNMQHNIQNGPTNGGYQGGPSNYQNSYPPSPDAV
ncbi:PREDICTED: uncharacterized protein At3g15000, mitochondrial isoform X1 [Populus euphratica]|uniref:Uncharacterized protein At3g15000, mitochondrial isoform X1 n=1 Tax=Populus euphratica TaxID=75702 RepID=A0AAJ6X5V0_POPEU|nr:PREDICTED: uncharacterized protein At3g15000, mitochondrial isoform X1 [Populus euphratica]